MKRFLAPILLVTLLFPSFALAASRGLEMDDLVERGGLFYEKFTDVPFTGEVTGQSQGSFVPQLCLSTPLHPHFR